MTSDTRRGRPRKPAEVKKLAGTFRKDREPVDQPQPSPITSDAPPIGLEREGAVMWREMLVELRRMGLLAGVDRGALATYCAAWQRFSEARRHMKRKHGPVITDKDGNMKLNPWFRVERAAIETLVRIATEFGFTPASRPRLGRSPKGADDPPPPQPTRQDDGPTLADLIASRPH